MSDKDRPDSDSGTAGRSPMDFRPTGELPRFGEHHPTGGFILDPHDDSDTGIGPVLPRYRDQPAGRADGADTSATSATADSTAPAASTAPEGSTGPAASEDGPPTVVSGSKAYTASPSEAKTRVQSEVPTQTGADEPAVKGGTSSSAVSSSAASADASSDSAASTVEPAEPAYAYSQTEEKSRNRRGSTYTTPSAPTVPASAADTNAETSAFGGAAAAAPTAAAPASLSSAERDEFGRQHNRRRGRERAAQARAEAEGIPVESADADASTPGGKRFGRPVGDESAELRAARHAAKRGTTDLGLLVLRVALGAILAAHGAQKLFGIWGGPGIDGFTQMLQNGSDPALGFDRFTRIIAIATGVVELGGGALLILGLLTPIAAAGAVGVMVSAALFKLTTGAQGFQFFAQKNGIEFEILLAAAAVAVLLAGPGRLSLDFNRGWSRRPHIGSVVWLLIGVGAAVAVWIVLNGSNPLAIR